MDDSKGQGKNGPNDPFEIGADEARQQFGELLLRALKEQRSIITRHGKPAAVLIGIEDFALLQRASTAKGRRLLVGVAA